MTVRTTYFGGIGTEVEPADDEPVVGVVRYPQDFVERVTDRNESALAPPSDLLDAYKAVEEAAERHGAARPAKVAWSSVSFGRRYLAYLARDDPREEVADLRALARERDLWLVCYEKDARWCHRRLLANEIVAEVEDVEVVHHPDPVTLDEPDASDDEPANATLDTFGRESA